MKHVLMFSYGIGSWAAGKLVASKHGTDNLDVLTADTKTEDEDTYAWGQAAARNIGGIHVVLADGRDVWQVFKDERFMGNSRVDPCSKILKRQLLRRYMEANYDIKDTVIYVGIHASEADRLKKIRERMLPWSVQAPLCEPPLIPYEELHQWANREGLWTQRLYRLGFPHANCGGFCVKAGQAHFRNLLMKMPERYAYHEQKEQELRDYLGKDVSILRDRSGGQTKPLTLRDFRLRIEREESCDLFDWGGCGCFSGDGTEN